MDDKNDNTKSMDEVVTPGGGDGAVQDDPVDSILTLAKKVKLDETNVGGEVEGQMEKQSKDDGTVGAGDKEIEVKENDDSRMSDQSDSNYLVDLKPMEARVVAEEMINHLDETFVTALFDRTGIEFEDFHSEPVNKFWI